MQSIYLSCEKIILYSEKCFQCRNISDSFYRNYEIKYLHDLMKKIVEYYILEKDNYFLKELAKFDENLYLYFFMDWMSLLFLELSVMLLILL